MTVDYIIVGQGLAGSCLALQLLKTGSKIAVFDTPNANICSTVAAGMFNPLTGRKISKTWFADQLFPYLKTFYKEAEQSTGFTFFNTLPMYKPFLSVEEQNEWMSEGENESVKGFIRKIETASVYQDVNDPFGGVEVVQTGFVNTPVFLGAVRALIKQNGLFFEENFQHQLLTWNENRVNYCGLEAKKIVFCEGIMNSSNPWFSSVPIKPLKGEIIVIKCDWRQQVILNRGVYMVPSFPQGEFKVGSTYLRDTTQPGTTEGGRRELEEKLKSLVRFPYLIKNQEWGIRPTTPDKKPVLGCHPESERLVIFNGLGSKGVSLAPYFSRLLAQWMEGASLLDKVVNVSRFKLLY